MPRPVRGAAWEARAAERGAGKIHIAARVARGAGGTLGTIVEDAVVSGTFRMAPTGFSMEISKKDLFLAKLVFRSDISSPASDSNSGL